MSNLFKAAFVTFSAEDKKVIKVDASDPRILNSQVANEEKDVDLDKIEKDKELQVQKEQIIASAKEEAGAIIEKAKVDAIQLKNAAVEEGQKSGYDAGYFQGYEAGKKDANALKEEVLEEKKKQLEAYETMLKEIEPQYAKLLIQLLEKITGILLEDREEIILYLINKGLNEIEGSKELIIHVSEEDYKYVLDHQDKINGIKNTNIAMDIQSKKNLTKGQCQIETEYGLIDSSVDAQLSLLIEDIKLLAKV